MDDGKGVSVPMMRGKLAMNFYEDENVTAAFLPMSGRETSLAILLPPEDASSLEEFINKLTAEDIRAVALYISGGRALCQYTQNRLAADNLV